MSNHKWISLFDCHMFSILGVAYLISSVSIDLSKYALDICKNTIGRFTSDFSKEAV